MRLSISAVGCRVVFDSCHFDKQRPFYELIPDISVTRILLVSGTCVYLLHIPKHQNTFPLMLHVKLQGSDGANRVAHYSRQASESIKYWMRLL
jgi:hypothetical protein